PRTGEIVHGHIVLPDIAGRYGFWAIDESVNPTTRLPGASPLRCTFPVGAAIEAGFGFDLLASRGLIDPDGPDGERFRAEFFADLTAHEMGHILGLSHNFRASTIHPLADICSPT